MSDTAVNSTENWLRNWVIELNLCPFARLPYDKGVVDIVSTEAVDSDSLFRFVMGEMDRLQQTPVDKLETTLVVVANYLQQFDDYLDFLELLEQTLIEVGLQGIIQIASFHPDYCFEGEDMQDPANYTNRSPYPMFHLIREDSLEKALAGYPEPEKIPQRNVELLRSMGIEKILQLLDR